MRYGLFYKVVGSLSHFNQEASTAAEVLVTNFCRFGVPRELHCHHGRNFRVSSDTGFATSGSKLAPHTCTLSRTAWWNATVEEHLRKVATSY
jgi:hypothetical protein